MKLVARTDQHIEARWLIYEARWLIYGVKRPAHRSYRRIQYVTGMQLRVAGLFAPSLRATVSQQLIKRLADAGR